MELGLYELGLSMNLERLKLDPLLCEHMKSPIPSIDCENNHVGNKIKPQE